MYVLRGATGFCSHSGHTTLESHVERRLEEAETLRQENSNLRVSNSDISKRLNCLVEAYLHHQYESLMAFVADSPPKEIRVTLPPSYPPIFFSADPSKSDQSTPASDLEKIMDEVDTLREVNTNLRLANFDLNNRLCRLEAYLQIQYPSVIHKFGGLRVREKIAAEPWKGCDGPLQVYVRGANGPYGHLVKHCPFLHLVPVSHLR